MSEKASEISHCDEYVGLQVVLENGCCNEEVQVQLYEARPGDPAVPQGKAFATISSAELGLPAPSQASCAHTCFDCPCLDCACRLDHSLQHVVLRQGPRRAGHLT